MATSFTSANPGRDVQRVGTARVLGQDPAKVHDPVWAVTGTLGDSQCYLGVVEKVAAIQRAVSTRICCMHIGFLRAGWRRGAAGLTSCKCTEPMWNLLVARPGSPAVCCAEPGS